MLNKRPGKGLDRPVDDLEKGNEAEAKTKPEKAAQWRDELDWTHSDPSFHFYKNSFCRESTSKIKKQKSNHSLKNKMMFYHLIPPIMVSLPKKMLTSAMSSSHALYSVSAWKNSFSPPFYPCWYDILISDRGLTLQINILQNVFSICWLFYVIVDNQLILASLPHGTCKAWDVVGNWVGKLSIGLHHLQQQQSEQWAFIWELKIA